MSARRATLRTVVGALAGGIVAGRAVAQGAQGAARDELLKAIRRDDPHAVRNALLRGADSNALDEFGEPVVVLAARSKAWAALRALAELNGTNLEATNRDGATALMFAALAGEQSTVEWLVIDRKAEVNKAGWTALHYAAANGQADVVRFLLERHAYIDAESPNGTTPLMMAARQAHPTTVRLLVDEGADPTPRNQSGWDAAAYAKAAGDPQLATWLTGQAEAFRRKYGTPGSRR